MELASQALAAVADKYPALSSLSNASEQVLNILEHRFGSADAASAEQIHGIFQEVNDHVLKEARTLFSNQSVVAALLADDKVKSFLLEQLGLAPQQSHENGSPAKVNGAAVGEPRTLSASATAAVPARGRSGMSAAELSALLKSQYTTE